MIPAGTENGWAPFALDRFDSAALLSPHWLFSSGSGDVALARRPPGGRQIQILDRKDQYVVEADGFDWIKPLDAKQSGAVPGQKVWRNPLPVVVMIVPTAAGVLLVRRGLPDGRGRLALPGGFQEVGETWQEAGCRETFEETGIALSPAKVRIFDIDTVENGTRNLIYGVYAEIVDVSGAVPQESEILEVLTGSTCQGMAFESHARMTSRFLAAR
jgi:ADP-ribose pyrophosphatase YjhB (NUDIX family)